jgi:hypothetical protein
MRAIHNRLTSSGLGSALPARRVQAPRMLSSASREEAVRSDREDLNVLLPTRCELSDTLSQVFKTFYARNTGLQVCVLFTSPQPVF